MSDADFLKELVTRTYGETGVEHSWGEPEYVDYHPQVEPQWVTRFGYRKPIVRYTCTACGKVLNGDGGSTHIILGLMQKTCPGPKPETTS